MQELQARTRNEAILYGLPLLVVFSLLLVSGTLAGKGYQSFNWVLTLTEEDKWLEVIHALGYLVGALVSAAGIFLLSAKKVFFLIWLVLSVLFLGEETSWGQRIFNYEVASVQAHSLQNEFNLHNLYFLNFGGLTSAENWRDVLKAMLDIQFLFQACFFAYFSIIPLVSYLSSPVRLLVKRFQYIQPTAMLSIVFTFLFVASYVAVLMVEQELYKNAIVEIRETLFALVVPAYLYQSYYRVRSRNTVAA
ncbi:MAG: hypothetical protein JJ891_16645 [Rhizobiaceae bacterium]|nr:hypothetical protein [Rhizobiaceae bacterium]